MAGGSIGTLTASLILQSAQFIAGMKSAADSTARYTRQMASDMAVMRKQTESAFNTASLLTKLGATVMALRRFNAAARATSDSYKDITDSAGEAISKGFGAGLESGLKGSVGQFKSLNSVLEKGASNAGKWSAVIITGVGALIAKGKELAGFTDKVEDLNNAVQDIPLSMQLYGGLENWIREHKEAKDVMTAFDQAIKEGADDESAWAASVTETKNALGLTTTEMKKLQDGIKEYTDTISEGIADAVVEAKTFEEALKDISKQLAKMALTSALKSIFGVASDAAFGTTGSTSAPLLHSGGVVGQTGARRSVPSGAFRAAPRFHSGFFPGEIPAILQRGESVLTRRQMKALRGGGVSAPVSISIDARGADAGGLARVEAQLRDMQRNLPTRIIKTVREARSRRVPL